MAAVKTVLCFGDSNTFGHIPGKCVFDRFDAHERWPGVLSGELGPLWSVIEEGLCGRTAREYPNEPSRTSARVYLTPCVQSHAPLNVVIMMLGTNDLQARFAQSPAAIAHGVSILVHDIRGLSAGPKTSDPLIVLVAPPTVGRNLREFKTDFEGAFEKSTRLASELKATAGRLQCLFFDASSVAECHDDDALHLGLIGHRALGVALAKFLLLNS